MTGNDTNIFICDHAVERYIERFASTLECITDAKDKRLRAENAIKQLFCESNYLSDDDVSILFRHRELKIDMLVKNRRLITLFTTRKRNGKR